MTAARVHRTAIVDRTAQLGVGVELGPGVIVGPKCTVGDGSVLGPRVVLERQVVLGAGVQVGVGTVLGSAPQDLKFGGDETWVDVGDRTIIREYSTVNRATTHSWRTTVGKDCFLMSYVHVAHDCQIGDGVTIANGTQLAGHVVIEDRATLSGLCAAHQFVRIGRHAFIGGCSRVAKDVPPYVKAVGNPVKLYGLNTIGLQRSGFPTATMQELKRAYRMFFNSDMNLSQAMERARRELPALPEVGHFLGFVEASVRGVGF